MINVNNTKDVVAKLFGKTHEETCNQLGLPQLSDERYAKSYAFGVHTTALGSGNGVTVFVGFKGYFTLIQFTLEYYPSCCGNRLFHTFKVDQRVTQEQMDEIMNTFFNENKYTPSRETSGFLGKANRIEVMMVEMRTDTYRNRDIMQDIEPVENPNITYKTLWNFFHKYGKRVRTRLELNPNTGNVLHNMEVLF